MLLDEKELEPVEVISSGSVLLDQALGVGGIPRGRIIELFGEEGAGKSSIALSTVAQAQKRGIVCAYIDAESALDLRFATALDVDTELLLISQENCTEDVLNLIAGSETGREKEPGLMDVGVQLIVVDSVAGLAPRAELEGAFGEWQVGLQARLMGQAMRGMAKRARATNTCLIFINQIREKIGVRFGNPETTPGGRALKFYATIRLDVRGRGQIKLGTEPVGIRISAYVAKNKVSPPFKRVQLDFFFDKGFDNELACFDIAAECGVIVRKGKSGYYTWAGEPEVSKLRKDWADYFRENVDKLKQLLDEVNACD